MALDWTDLLAGIAIVCILEGVMPFINPAGMKRVLAQLATLDERRLRIGGLCSMLAGLIILFMVRS